MSREIWIGTYYNLYESKKYFSAKLAEALRRQGFKVSVLDLNFEENLKFFGQPHERRPMPYFFCSFNRTPADAQGLFFFDVYKVPNLSILVDPAIYDMNIIKSPYSIISCVDKFDCEYVKQNNFEKVFFFPHAVERELGFDELQERPYDVVFLGSCYDHPGLHRVYRHLYPDAVWHAIQDGIEMYQYDSTCTLWQAADWVLNKGHLAAINRDIIIYYIDNYVRGLDRYELIRSIKDAQVHVFGATCWRPEAVRGWSQALAGQPNVVVHPAIPFKESLEILKRSKICLNSMPFFKNGTHERIFTGLACGCLPVTTENLWVRDNFVENEELVLYQQSNRSHINDKINYYLADETERRRVVMQGHAKVMRDHTWDQRAEQLLQVMPPFVDAIKARS